MLSVHITYSGLLSPTCGTVQGYMQCTETRIFLYIIFCFLTVCLLATDIHRFCDMGPTKHRFLTPFYCSRLFRMKAPHASYTVRSAKCGAVAASLMIIYKHITQTFDKLRSLARLFQRRINDATQFNESEPTWMPEKIMIQPRPMPRPQ